MTCAKSLCKFMPSMRFRVMRRDFLASPSFLPPPWKAQKMANVCHPCHANWSGSDDKKSRRRMGRISSITLESWWGGRNRLWWGWLWIVLPEIVVLNSFLFCFIVGKNDAAILGRSLPRLFCPIFSLKLNRPKQIGQRWACIALQKRFFVAQIMIALLSILQNKQRNYKVIHVAAFCQLLLFFLVQFMELFIQARLDPEQTKYIRYLGKGKTNLIDWTSWKSYSWRT